MKKFAARMLLAGIGLTVAAWPVQAQGLMLSNGGAMSGQMAGTSTAVPVDAVGALFWNPATMSGLARSEVTIGSNLLIPHNGITSTVPAGAYGPLGPATTLSGRTNSDNALTPTTALAIVYRPDDSPWTFGLGMSSVAAGGVNYPGDANNPVLSPTGPGPLGLFVLGPQAGAASILSITPSVSYQVTDRLAVGGGPMIDVMSFSVDPAFFGPPSKAGLLTPFQFPTGSHTPPFWGGGFRGGLTYKVLDHITTGVSYTSPQWFQTLKFNGRNASGDAISFSLPFSLPQIFSSGVAYDGIKDLLLAADLRYFDYSTTQLLGQPLSQSGAAWSSVWAVSIAASYQLTDRLSVQGGYLYNDNPVPSNLAFFNSQLPCITQNTLTCGVHFQLNETIGTSLGYAHGFENTVGGSAAQAIGSSTFLDLKYDAVTLGIHIKSGAPKCKPACACEPVCAAASTAPVINETAPTAMAPVTR